MRDRMKKFLDFKGLSVSSAETKSGISNGTLSNFLKGTNIQINNLAKFANAFKDLNYHWLVTGEGDMLLPEDGVDPVVFVKDEEVEYFVDAKMSVVKWMQKIEEEIKALQDASQPRYSKKTTLQK